MKLWQDFGVTAWFGTLIIVGTFAIIGVGIYQGKVDIDLLVPMFSSWVGAIIAAYFTIKARKTGQ